MQSSLPKGNKRLRQHRIERNWRQQDVADLLETSLVSVQRWERGIQQPSLYYRARLCTLFGLNAQELGLVEASCSSQSETAAPAEEPVGKEVALWTVPYRRNPLFTGREEVLEQLLYLLVPGAVDQSASLRRVALTQAQALTGLGGIGKTQIAVEYAYRALELGYYTHTLWITAASEEAILTSFAALAEYLPVFAGKAGTDQHQLVKAIIEWLEQCEQPWLLIFDNADDLAVLQPYVPRRGNGSVLLTTRASAVSSLASSLQVETMGIEEGTRLLLRRGQHLAQATDEEIDKAANLVVALGQLPLALDQAGAYIEETGCSLGDYLQLYQQHRYRLLARRGMQATGYPEPVATTWSLSFERVKEANAAAAELLHLCAFLAPDHIPEELLIQGAPYWSLLLQEAVTDPFTFNQLLETLLRFSLVKRLSEERMLSIHRLVQVVQAEAMEPEVQRQWAERLVLAVHAIFPRDPAQQIASWPLCQRYLEQAQACSLLIQAYQLQLSEAAELLNRVGSYLSQRALYPLAEPLYQQALHLQEQLLGPEHPEVTTSLYGLAYLYLEQGKYAQSEPLFLQALRIREQHLGPDDLQVATGLYGLGLLYWRQGKYAQSEPLHRRALRIREQHLGPEHPEVAWSLHGLAAISSGSGTYVEAEQLYQRALRIWEQQLGSEHLYLACSLNNLAEIYSERGRYALAEQLYQRALRIWEQQLGPEHPRVIYPLDGLADLYRKQGKYAEAEQLYRRALRTLEQQLGPEHLLAASLLSGLANLYYEQGRYVEAGPLYQQALHIRERELKAEHRDTAALLHDFARFQQTQGYSSEAARLYRRALMIREHVLGPDHPFTTESRKQLYAVLLELGRMEEARALLAC